MQVPCSKTVEQHSRALNQAWGLSKQGGSVPLYRGHTHEPALTQLEMQLDSNLPSDWFKQLLLFSIYSIPAIIGNIFYSGVV